MKGYFKNESNNKQVKVKIGFHWFGPLFPLLSGACSFGFFVKEYLKGFVIFPIFSMHKRLVNNLISEGYKLKAVEGGTLELVEAKLGYSVPSLD